MESGVRLEIELDVKEKLKELPSASRDIKDIENWAPADVALEDDLNEAGDEAVQALREKQREVINSLPLDQYAIAADEDDWKAVKINGGSNRVSIPNNKSTKKRKHDSVQGTADLLGIFIILTTF